MLIRKDKGVQRGAGRTNDLGRPLRRINNQLRTETISLYILRQTLLWREEQLWINPDCDDPDMTLFKSKSQVNHAYEYW